MLNNIVFCSFFFFSLTDKAYLCLAVLNSTLSVIFLHGRNTPLSSPINTPRLMKSLSLEIPPDDSNDRMMSPMHYARSGLGTAELNGKLIAAGKWLTRNVSNASLTVGEKCGNLTVFLGQLFWVSY